MPDLILGVGEVNEYVRKKLSSDVLLKRVSVKGEISEFKVYGGSGHAYFTLKDETSLLKCVMFRSNLSCVNFRPQVGSKVIATGQISLYVPNGSYQMTVESMKQEGEGDLFARFQMLKSRLEAEGLFDQSIKKPIPLKVKTIGVATSLSGAAIRDIIKVARARNPRINIIIAPCAVQGKGSENEIAASVTRLDRCGKCDVILVGRGGGSTEDLWSFNEEVVARAIFACTTPVINCVGHETDFSIADFTADVRASTPSNAAELAVCDIYQLTRHCEGLRQRLNHSVITSQRNRRLKLEAISKSAAFKNPRAFFIDNRRKDTEQLKTEMFSAMCKRMNEIRLRLESGKRMLDTLNPDNVKKRGYACVKKSGRVVESITGVKTNDAVVVELSDGRFEAAVSKVGDYE